MKKVVHLVAAARPNFMKVAPLYHALRKTDWCEPQVVYTGQHYDDNMAGVMMRDLGIVPCTDLRMPHVAVVPGDVRDARRAALDYVDSGVPVVHLEAGLRSFDRTMPEEINRIVIDAVSSLCWTPSADADENLTAEGNYEFERVGNIMIDAFEMLREKIDGRRYCIPPKPYAVVTLHRPSNVDDPVKLKQLVEQINRISALMRVFFPVHPRTAANLRSLGVWPHACRLDPMSYINFMALVMDATLVITDSGGVQEETTYLGVPCATVRENTERPVTLEGTNRLVQPSGLVAAAEEALSGKWDRGVVPPLWDGKTAGRCVDSLARFLGETA